MTTGAHCSPDMVEGEGRGEAEGEAVGGWG